MSEEAQEARNKDIRRYRESFTRKSSRLNTNEDLIKRLLISSDPYITSLRKSIKNLNKILSTSVLKLLNLELTANTEDDINNSSNDEEDLNSSSNDESVCMFILIYTIILIINSAYLHFRITIFLINLENKVAISTF